PGVPAGLRGGARRAGTGGGAGPGAALPGRATLAGGENGLRLPERSAGPLDRRIATTGGSGREGDDFGRGTGGAGIAARAADLQGRSDGADAGDVLLRLGPGRAVLAGRVRGSTADAGDGGAGEHPGTVARLWDRADAGVGGAVVSLALTPLLCS